MEYPQISISDGNSKMGDIPSVSLIPIVDCLRGAPCRRECYAMKAFRQYPDTRAAYRRNSRIAHRDLTDFFGQIKAWFKRKRKPVPFFRWHVGGDIISGEYFARMVLLASDIPNTRFLVFTKRADIVNAYPLPLPENLTVVLSAWPGMPLDNPKGLPVAWMVPCDKSGLTEPRLPSDAIRCPGTCDRCGMCYSLRELGRDVAFDQH